jgi:type VI secretion system protein ImpA
MLTPELVEALQAPISEASPSGDDLEYDPAFIALEAVAQGKAEQQFGDTVIPAVEPEWRAVGEQAQALLQRSKDVRPAMLLLRAATRQQGISGFDLGIRLVTGLLATFWDCIHPKLDADDDNDPTMRLNALAPLTGETLVLRDFYDAGIGLARGVGPITVRDIAIAHNVLTTTGGEASYSPAQVHGALGEIQAEHPEILLTLMGLPTHLQNLQTLLTERTGLSDAIDLAPLRRVAVALRTACNAVTGSDADAAAEGADGSAPSDGDAPTGARVVAPRGDLNTRQDALQMLDRVIRFLEQTEPGNPAPLLIARAKRLIGVSFLEIMADLAPNAIDTIENVTGRPPSE